MADFEHFKPQFGYFRGENAYPFDKCPKGDDDMSRIDNCIAEYKEWCHKLDIATVSDLNALTNAGKSDWIINISEIWQEQKLSELAKQIKDHIEEKRLIFISGPSSSGKTSFAHRLQLHLRVLGIRALAISLDDYYLPHEAMPKNELGDPDFEALESIDYMRFNHDMADLIAGKTCELPLYDFQNRKASKETKRVTLKPDEVMIVEGIHGLNPKLSSLLPDRQKYKIYCSALNALEKDSGERIRSRDTRLIRRIIRDAAFRNSDYVETLSLWQEVEKGAIKNVFPYTDDADIIFNSSLLYELAVYKTPFLRLINAHPCPAEYQDQVKNLKSLLEPFVPISPEHTPHTSLLREFIGGTTLF